MEDLNVRVEVNLLADVDIALTNSMDNTKGPLAAAFAHVMRLIILSIREHLSLQEVEDHRHAFLHLMMILCRMLRATVDVGDHAFV